MSKQVINKKANQLLKTIQLPKWSGLLVSGNPVPEETAAEINIRTTDLLWMPYNYPNVLKEFYETIFDPLIKEVFPDQTFDKPTKQTPFSISDLLPFNKFGIQYNQFIQFLRDTYRLLDKKVYHLTNHNILTNFYFGPIGWCSWDGKIHANSFNLLYSKPDLIQVYNEWCILAEEFPELQLQSQLLSGEITDEDSFPLVTFTVDRGKVEVTRKIVTKIVEPKTEPESETAYLKIGISSADLKSKMDRLRSKKR